MNNFCTSIEQSKKLIELGLNPKSADMRHVFCATVMTKDVYQLEIGGEPESNEEYIPAWSLSALLGLLPNTIDGMWPALIKNEDGYFIEGSHSTFNNPLDTVFEMVCLLLENKKKYERYKHTCNF